MDSPSTFAEDFLHFLLEGNLKFALNAFSKDELLDGQGVRTTHSVVEESIGMFVNRVMTFIERHIEEIECVVEGTHANVRFTVRWDGLMADSFERKRFSGIARVTMKRNPYHGWDVVQAIVPGWNA